MLSRPVLPAGLAFRPSRLRVVTAHREGRMFSVSPRLSGARA